ncbi:MAG: methyltransferase type 11, partial [Candidatus Komeilibacteria bacterium]|nr:methyltransferase type 11 [Candidatus Komeilibacteria bacterium]
QLSAGGTFLVYQYSPLVLPILKKYFKKVKLYYEVRNLFPYFIMVAEKEIGK